MERGVVYVLLYKSTAQDSVTYTRAYTIAVDPTMPHARDVSVAQGGRMRG